MLSGVDLDDWTLIRKRMTHKLERRATRRGGILFEMRVFASSRASRAPLLSLVADGSALLELGSPQLFRCSATARLPALPRNGQEPHRESLGHGVLLEPLRRVLDLDLIHLGCQDEVGQREPSDRVRAQLHPDVSVGSDVHIRVVPLLLGQDADLCHLGPFSSD